MRYKKLIDKQPVKEVMDQSRSSDKFKRSILAHAADPEQMVFAHLSPEETGLSRTIWVSEDGKFPYVIVAKSTKPVRWVTPENGVVVPFNGTIIQYDDVNTWLEKNRKLLPLLANGTIDIVDFYEKMVVFTKSRQLHEMVKASARRWNLPYDVYCSPGTGTNNTTLPHDARVKVMMPDGNAINIALRPIRYEPADQNPKLSPKDFA